MFILGLTTCVRTDQAARQMLVVVELLLACNKTSSAGDGL